MKLKLDLHEMYDRSGDIDRALRAIIEEAVAKKAPLVEIIPAMTPASSKSASCASSTRRRSRPCNTEWRRTPTTSAGSSCAWPSGGFGLSATPTLTAEQTRLLAYLDTHRGSARYVMATTSWNTAAPYIEATGQKVLPMGGFSGSVPEPTLAAFKQLVHSGQVKFVMVTTSAGFGGGPAGVGGTSTVASITTWVQSACATVPAAA